MSTAMLLLVGLCLGFIRIVISGDCFWIDGIVAQGHTPCYDLSTVGASMCCASGSSNFSSCTAGGICLYNSIVGAQGPYDQGKSFWRDSCSDPSWQDPACLAMAPYVKSSDVRLNKCADGSFCPRNQNDINMTCCNNHQGQNATNNGATLPPTPTASFENSEQAIATPTSVSASLSNTFISPSGLTSSATSVDVSSSSFASLSTPRLSADGEDGLSKAQKIATIFGSVVGVISLLAAILFGINGWKARKARQRQQGL